MKISKFLGSVAIGVTLAISPVAVASAHQSAPVGFTLKAVKAKRTTFFYICMAQNGSLCIQGMGAGNNVEVTTSGNVWQKISVTGGIEFQNSSGHCLKATSGGDVTVVDTACDGGASKIWKVGGSGNTTFYSNYANGYMGDFGPSNGNKVYTRMAMQGFWYGWQLF